MGWYAVRNIYDFDCQHPTEFWFVIKDSFGGMEELSSKMRNQVRRSLRECDIRPITKQELLDKGYPIYCAAAEGYRVKLEAPTLEAFEERINTCGEEYEFWGVFIKGTELLIAFSMNRVTADCCNYSTMKADPAHQKQCYPYYGLIYEMNRHYLEERGLKYVNDGARSITNHSNIQPFLIEKFHFRRAYCHLTIHYRCWLRLAVNVLYPFRQLIPIRSVRSLLDMEWMARHSKS